MKHLLLFFIALASIGFMNCDGKDRARTSIKKNVIDSELSSAFFTKEHYIPKDYTEHTLDSILSNGYHVSIKMTTNKDVILKEVITDNITRKNYYRDFDAEIIVKKNDRIVFNHVVNKHFIKKQNPQVAHPII